MKQTLRKTLALKALMLVAMLVGAINGAWAEGTTGTITFGKNDVVINSASVTGDDDLGNTWTITTTGTTSFTSNGAYYQVGSSKAPASSITFTTTLSEDMNITAFEAKFGGFSGTAGDITLKVGDNTVGEGSLDATSDVTVSSTSAKTGKVLTVTVTNIDKGVKAYYISYTYTSTGGDTPTLEESDLTLTGAPVALSFDLYNNSNAQVISYTTSSTGEVTVSESDYIETSVNATDKTITVTPKKKTATAQTITVSQAKDATYAAGSTTFTVTIDDSTPKTGGWQKAELSDLTEGDVFVIVGDNGSTFAMTNDNGTVSAPAAVEVEIANDEITSDVAENIQWNISGNETDGYIFYPNGSTETWLYCTNSNNGVRVGTNASNTFSLADGYLYHNGTSRYVGIYNSSDWRCYTSINTNIKDQSFSFYKYADDAAVKAPVITVAETFVGSTTATITCSPGDATIYYSYDNVTWNEYTEALTITTTTTIYAKAVKGEDESNVVSKTTTKTLPTPTIAIDATDITNTNVYEGTAAGSLSASVTYNDAAIEGATVTWSGNNDEVATINATTGAVTLVGAGSVTFTASYPGVEDEYNPASDTYKMTVTNSDPNAPGSSAENAYTVAQALEVIAALADGAKTPDYVYVKGVISQIDEISVSYGNATYWIIDDDKTDSPLEVFRGKYLNQASFTAEDQIQLKDEVIIYGQLQKYVKNDIVTPELAQNNYIVSLSRKELADAELSFGETTAFTIKLGDSFTAPTLSYAEGFDGTVTYTSSNEAVATVAEDGTVTVKGAGQTTITVSFAGDDTYKAGSVSYTLNVVDATRCEVIEFDFTSNAWGLPTDYVTDEAEYSNGIYNITLKGTGSNGYKFNDNDLYLILGKTDAYLTLPAFNADVTRIDVVGRGNASTKVKQNILVDGESVSSETVGAQTTNTYKIAQAAQSAGTIYTLQVLNENNTQIKYIKVYAKVGDYYTRSGLTVGNYGTICLPYDADVEGAQLYSIAGKGENYISLAEVASAKAGVPYIFKATATELVATYTDLVMAPAGTADYLVGTIGGTPVAEGMYVISNNTVAKCGTGCKVGDHRAYINLDQNANAPADPIDEENLVKLFFNGAATAINSVNAAQLQGEAYDLTGRRVKAVKGGLYIVNGKKIVK